jgi:cytochrome c oxidase subunit 4
MATENNHHDNVGHVVPLPLLGAVIAALMVLTWLTVFVTKFDLGSLNIFVALGIAVIKGALVVLFFMHLRWDAPINGIVLISSLLLVFLFVGFALMDSAAYAPDQIPGYAPLINP